MYILPYSYILRYNQTYPGIFRKFSSKFCALCNPDIFRTCLVYSGIAIPETHLEHYYIQNCCTFRTKFIFRILDHSQAYSEPGQASMMKCFEEQLTAVIKLARSNYFCNINFLSPLVHEINAGLILTAEVFNQ